MRRIFAIPSAGLHSLSVLRALGCGLLCLVSDAPGYEELIEHGRTGWVVPGRYARIYSRDRESGWLRDDYGSMLTPDPVYAENLGKSLLQLWRDPLQRTEISERGKAMAVGRFAFGPWARRVEKILRGAL